MVYREMVKRYLLVLLTACLWLSNSVAQTSDSLIVDCLQKEGVKFSRNNSVTLLMNGQEKFDDMFSAIRQARSSYYHYLAVVNFQQPSA